MWRYVWISSSSGILWTFYEINSDMGWAILLLGPWMRRRIKSLLLITHKELVHSLMSLFFRHKLTLLLNLSLPSGGIKKLSIKDCPQSDKKFIHCKHFCGSEGSSDAEKIIHILWCVRTDKEESGGGWGSPNILRTKGVNFLQFCAMSFMDNPISQFNYNLRSTSTKILLPSLITLQKWFGINWTYDSSQNVKTQQTTIDINARDCNVDFKETNTFKATKIYDLIIHIWRKLL